MKRINIPAVFVGLVACCILAGCTTKYVFEFKHGKSNNPVINAPVKATSCHRMYSYLDLRHYLAADSHKSVIAEGRTDSQGKVSLALPGDLGIRYVCLNNEWFARAPSSEWQPMLRRREYETKATEPDIQVEQIRPLIRMRKK